jgi:sodium transport system permease protein
MTVLFTTSPRRTLLLKVPRWSTLPAAAGLAVLLHPAAIALQTFITRLYPVSEETAGFLEKVLADAPGLGPMVLLMAVLPAICEELAFRGFILSGLRHLGHKWRAIFYSALLFGISHMLLQQSIAATILGVVIAILAVQSGSILPGMIFHAVHNSLALAAGHITPELAGRYPLFQRLVTHGPDGSVAYQWPVLLVTALLAAGVIYWFLRLPYRRSSEERRHDALVKAWQAE